MDHDDETTHDAAGRDATARAATRQDMTVRDRAVRDIAVRDVAAGDVEAIAAYHHRCWLSSFAHLMEPGVVEAMDPRGKVERLRTWFAPGSGLTTAVAVHRGTPVGHVSVEGNELVHLFIDPDHHGRGLGTLLLERGERTIRAAGHRTAELHTIVGNRPAIALYESAGWIVTDRLVHNEHDGVVYDEHVLVKQFEPAAEPDRDPGSATLS